MSDLKLRKYSSKELRYMSIEHLKAIDQLLTSEQSGDQSQEQDQSFIFANENAFNWIGENEYGNTYYYPVIPKFNRQGFFDEDNLGLQSDQYGNDKIPFGGIEWDGTKWTSEDLIAPVTNELYQNQALQFNIISELVETNVQDDLSGNKNFGFVIGDYTTEFEIDTSTPKEIQNTIRLKKNKNDGAF